MITILLPALVALVGLLMYVLATNPKVVELGKILFAVGALVTCWILANHSFHL